MLASCGVCGGAKAEVCFVCTVRWSFPKVEMTTLSPCHENQCRKYDPTEGIHTILSAYTCPRTTATTSMSFCAPCISALRTRQEDKGSQSARSRESTPGV